MADEEILEAFRTFDKNGDGFITQDELIQVLKELGEDMSDEEVEEMIAEADADNDGKINFEEFKKMMGGDGLAKNQEETSSEVQEKNLLGINYEGAIYALKLIGFPFKDPFDGKEHQGTYKRPDSLKWVTDMCGDQLVGYDVAQAVKIYLRANDGKDLSMCEVVQKQRPDLATRAKKFISHVQLEPINETLEAMCDSEEKRATVWWVDFFTLCQCKNDFHVDRVIKIIDLLDETVVILNEKRGGLPYVKRIFCIFEIFATLKGNKKLTVFSRNPSRVLQILEDEHVDAKDAEARNEKDKVQISKFVEDMEGGFQRLNKEFKAAVSAGVSDLSDAFKVFDKDLDGFIGLDDLRATTESLGEKLSEEELQEMMLEADRDGDGKLDYFEFTRMMNSE